MAEITPSPSTGSWLEITDGVTPYRGEYATGSWLEITPGVTPYRSEYATGSWLEITADFIPRRRIRRGLGIVHTRSR